VVLWLGELELSRVAIVVVRSIGTAELTARTTPAEFVNADGRRTFPAGCASRTLLDHITSKWGVLIIVSLADGPHRWSELRRRAEGVSEKMLAQTLDVLEGDGLVHRDAQPVIPPRVDYSLTDKGESLAAVLLPLVDWTFWNADNPER